MIPDESITTPLWHLYEMFCLYLLYQVVNENNMRSGFDPIMTNCFELRHFYTILLFKLLLGHKICMKCFGTAGGLRYGVPQVRMLYCYAVAPAMEPRKLSHIIRHNLNKSLSWETQIMSCEFIAVHNTVH